MHTQNMGNLKYPISLITADEVVLAGGLNSLKNEKFYLNSEVDFWTISPSMYARNYLFPYNVKVISNGSFSFGSLITDKAALRPVINISSDVLISSGDGSIEHPYELTLSK